MGRKTWFALAFVGALTAALPFALRAVAPVHSFGTRSLAGVSAVVAVYYVGISGSAVFAAGGTWRRIAGRILLAIVAAALIVGGFELPTLLFDYDWRRLLARQDESFFGRIKPWKNPWNVRDPELVFRRPPNEHVTGQARGDCAAWLGIAGAKAYEYDLAYDARGYRNPRTLESATIAVLGDSFVEAAFVRQEELLTTLLERSLDVPVGNFGVGGYGPQQELIVLQRDVLPLAPRLVFWCFFEGNDLMDSRRFPRDAVAASSFEPDFSSRSFTMNLVTLVARASAREPSEDGAEARRSSGRLRVPGKDQGATLYFPYPSRTLSEVEVQSLAEVLEIFAVAEELCSERGSQIVLVFVPEKFRVYGDLCDFPPDSSGREWKPSDLPGRIAERAAAEGIPFLDLTAPLQRAAANGELVYFTDDGHWNALGHAVVAREFAEAARPCLLAEAR